MPFFREIAAAMATAAFVFTAQVAVSGDVDNITVHVRDGANAMSVGIKRGTRVNLTVHGAGANQLHLQGYGITFAGDPASASFDADQTGRFALQMHGPRRCC